jgi:HTH-type transcriptional regulator/antitoxin HigA
MKMRKAAETFPPGDFIREELEARGWTRGDLARIIDRSERAVNELINGRRGVTPEIALALSAAFDTSPEFWMNLQNMHALAHAQTDTRAIEKRKRQLLSSSSRQQKLLEQLS